MSNGEQGANAGAKRPHDECGCDNEAEQKALKEVVEAKAKVAEAEVEMEQAIRDERAAGHLLERAEEDLEESRQHKIRFWLDAEEHTTEQRKWTPNAIIKDFGERDPAKTYLVKIEGHHKESFQGKGEIPIELQDCERFQMVSTGPTPVADGTPRTGIEVVIAGLKALGFEPSALDGKPDHVLIDYVVETGKFAGKQVRLGFVVPSDFPLTPPGGIHVSPRIHPNKNGKTHPTEGIRDSNEYQSKAGGEWHYWSRPVRDWTMVKKTVASYMGHVWQLWDSQ